MDVEACKDPELEETLSSIASRSWDEDLQKQREQVTVTIVKKFFGFLLCKLCSELIMEE